jgi:hypothetical protein
LHRLITGQHAPPLLGEKMKTYMANMYYPTLREAQSHVRHCQEAVKTVAGNNWRMIKAGGNMLSIVFASDMDHRRMQSTFNQGAGGEGFALLIVEVSAVVGGWIERSAYEWLDSRLRRD